MRCALRATTSSSTADVRYLLIGGGVASYNAAKQIRRADSDGSILMACEELVPPYDRPPLSKEYLRGEKSFTDLAYESIDDLEAANIDLALGASVESINAAARTARDSTGRTVHFEKALIATGGRPVRLNLPGADLTGVHYLRTVADTDGIAAEAEAGRRAVIVGGGFIGVELAASLTQRGLSVTVIEALPRIWQRFAEEQLSSYIQRYCSDRGVVFRTETSVAALEGDGRVSAVVTVAGESLPAGLVCIGVGIRPNVELASAAGLALDNGIVVDEFLRSSDPNIYAAGDVINYFDAIAGKRRRVEHWGHAEYSGQVAGKNMAGASVKYDFLSYVWSDIFDLHLEFAGDESDHDMVVQRGSLDDRTFEILYLKEDRLSAFYGINTSDRDLGSLRRLIQTKRDLTGRDADLQNPEFNLRGLL
jgi:3-phenylpropionate/trans-cinnamate dioxygenase ferredoxin reductase component